MGASRNQSRDPSRPPRPINCFMAFRLDKYREVTEKCATLNHRDVSKVIARMWKEADPKVKAHYRKIAEDAHTEHVKKYPDYRYNPMRKETKTKRHYKHKIDAVTRKKLAQENDAWFEGWCAENGLPTGDHEEMARRRKQLQKKAQRQEQCQPKINTSTTKKRKQRQQQQQKQDMGNLHPGVTTDSVFQSDHDLQYAIDDMKLETVELSMHSRASSNAGSVLCDAFDFLPEDVVMPPLSPATSYSSASSATLSSIQSYTSTMSAVFYQAHAGYNVEFMRDLLQSLSCESEMVMDGALAAIDTPEFINPSLMHLAPGITNSLPCVDPSLFF
ncbi:hypothetical protein BC940DRAFT_321981 [Gongronella butleri]|nr:hypothetical protein BC940DRAFT_321981 [Gongronella butleri]